MPLSVRIGLTAVLLLIAAGLTVTARRGSTGRLSRQGLAGVRTPSAMVDDAAFERANVTAAPFLYAAAGFAVLLCLFVDIVGGRTLAGPAEVIVGGVVLGGTVLAGGLRGDRAARRGLSQGQGGSPVLPAAAGRGPSDRQRPPPGGQRRKSSRAKRSKQ